MGLNDKEIVALSSAHTLGRSRPERSGWGKQETKYTKDGPGARGGQSWTVQWLKFDNSYFKVLVDGVSFFECQVHLQDIKERRDKGLLVLPTDAVVFEDPSFKEYAEKYAGDQDAFFKEYAEAHAKPSNFIYHMTNNMCSFIKDGKKISVVPLTLMEALFAQRLDWRREEKKRLELEKKKGKEREEEKK